MASAANTPAPDVDDRGPAAYVGELLGTLVLVLFIAFVLSVYQTSASGLGYIDFSVIGLVHLFVLGMLIASLGGTTGAHFNPAVTVTLYALRKIKGADAAIYIIMQFVGAILAALIVKAILKDEGAAVGYGSPSISEKFLQGDVFPAMIVEAIGTFVLMWAIMGVAVNPRAERSWAPLIIGGTLGFAVMCFGPLTGAGLNPARSFGPLLVAGDLFDNFGDNLLAYAIGPIIGATLAGVAYTALVLQDQERLFGGRLVDTDVPPGRLAGEVEALESTPGERPIDKLS